MNFLSINFSYDMLHGALVRLSDVVYYTFILSATTYYE